MANISFSITVVGAGSVELPVILPDGEAVELAGLGTIAVRFVVSNPLDRTVSIPQLSLAKEGTAKDKVSLSLLNDAVSIPANGTAENKVQIEANQPLLEGDSVKITVTGSEA